MLEKLAAGFIKLKRQVAELAQRVESLPAPKDGKDADHQAIVRDVLAQIPTPKDGKDVDHQAIVRDVLAQIPAPKDGESPKAEDVAALVLKLVPTPKDGKDADHQAIVRDVLAQIPAPKDGRDAQPPLLSDVVEVLMARIPKPKDGKDGVSPSPQAVAEAMPPAKPGKNGVSITDVKLDKNILFVWLDGVKKKVGKIELPAVVPSSLGGGGGSRLPADNARVGFFDYNDSATAITPINIPAGVPVKLTNDTLGPFTNRDYKPAGVPDIWNPTTNQFDFTGLKLGDMLDIRVDAILTTTQPNQSFRLGLVLGIGAPSEYEIPFASGVTKTVGPIPVSRYNGLYIGNAITRDNPGDFYLVSDAPATLVVNGWYCKVVVRG